MFLASPVSPVPLPSILWVRRGNDGRNADLEGRGGISHTCDRNGDTSRQPRLSRYQSTRIRNGEPHAASQWETGSRLDPPPLTSAASDGSRTLGRHEVRQDNRCGHIRSSGARKYARSRLRTRSGARPHRRNADATLCCEDFRQRWIS